MPRHFGCYYPTNWLWPHKKSAELTSESDKVIHILYGVFYSTLILVYLFHFHSVTYLLVLLGPQWGYVVYAPFEYYILGRQANDPCEYRTWISVVVPDLILKASLELFVG